MTRLPGSILRSGRLAYRNPYWTPAYGNASLIRDPAGLAHSPGDVITVLAAVHHAVDAINQIAATDHAAVLETAASSGLYVPIRLLPDKYDIPHSYPHARVRQCAPGHLRRRHRGDRAHDGSPGRPGHRRQCAQ
jgi:hypothetical protein